MIRKRTTRSRGPQVAVVIGARPQFVKAAALEAAYRRGATRKKFSLLWIHTGQHYDHTLSGVFFKELSLPDPRYHLGVGSMPPGAQTALMIERLEKIFLRERPELVLVFGDTNSTLAGALAAAKMGIPVAHVEAGLRGFNRALPEEINRILTDRISDMLFCPLDSARTQLNREGIRRGIHVVGDVMADILFFYNKRIRKPDVCAPYYLATIHRNTNTDDPRRLRDIFLALSALRRPVILPLHPRTKAALLGDERLKKAVSASGALRLIEPVSYLEMLSLEKYAEGIITDSGGVQKEAFLLGVPCVTLRKETEWNETIARGRNVLCEPDPRKIAEAFRKIGRQKGPVPGSLYGGGRASEKILRVIAGFLHSGAKTR